MEKAQATTEEEKLYYRQAIDILDKAIVSDDEILYEQALTLAEKCIFHAPREPEFLYLAGYIIFITPNKGLEKWRSSERYLKECIELKPDHQLALYYLACSYFYQKSFNEALKHFTKIQIEAFRNMGQDWRITKIKELAFCCDAYISRTIQFETFEEVLQLYYSFSDVSLAPVPRELAACLEFLENVGTNLNLLNQCHKDFVKLLKYLDIENLIYKEFKRFKPSA